jgi:hypothetical protein
MALTLPDAMLLAGDGAELDLSNDDPDDVEALLVALLDELPALERVAGSVLLTAMWRWGVSSNALGEARRGFLCAMLDDARQTESVRYDAALLLLTDGDEESLRSLAARSRVGSVPADVGARALLAMDPVEGFEELVECYRKNPAWRRRIAALLNGHADPRWLDEALAVVSEDPENACATLGALGTERAREELLGWIDAASMPLDQRARMAVSQLKKLGDERGDEAVERLVTQRNQ